MWRRLHGAGSCAGTLSAASLRGEKPADLPVQQVVRIELLMSQDRQIARPDVRPVRQRAPRAPFSCNRDLPTKLHYNHCRNFDPDPGAISRASDCGVGSTPTRRCPLCRLMPSSPPGGEASISAKGGAGFSVPVGFEGRQRCGVRAHIRTQRLLCGAGSYLLTSMVGDLHEQPFYSDIGRPFECRVSARLCR